jgi:hypothetical protein
MRFYKLMCLAAMLMLSLVIFGCGTTSHYQIMEQIPNEMKCYKVLEVAEIENFVPQTFSEQWCVRLKETLIAYARKTGRFDEVVDTNDQVNSQSVTNVLIFKPTVTGYEAGSGVKRYFVGFGAGKAVLNVKGELFDKITGEKKGCCILTSEAMQAGSNVFTPMGQQFAAFIIRFL